MNDTLSLLEGCFVSVVDAMTHLEAILKYCNITPEQGARYKEMKDQLMQFALKLLNNS